MRLTPMLPLAAILLVGSCRDAGTPITGLAEVGVGPSQLFTPLAALTHRVNAAGTRIQSSSNQWIRTTSAGVSESVSDMTYVTNLDEDGIVYGAPGAAAKIFYWEPGQSAVELTTPTSPHVPTAVSGRKLPGGEIVIAAKIHGAATADDKVYRWSSQDGWELIAAVDGTKNPNVIGVTADGSVVWFYFDGGGRTIYRTARNDDVIQYQVPAGHQNGNQYPAGTSSPNAAGALDPSGALVGASNTSGGTAVPVRWAPDGTPTILPVLLRGEAREIRGDYVVGVMTNAAPSIFAITRWHWNGSSWETAIMAEHAFGPAATKVNSSGMLAVQWTAGSKMGWEWGMPGYLMFRNDAAAASTMLPGIDDAGRVLLPHGILTPEPELGAPAAVAAAAGVPMALPLTILSPLGGLAYPISWSVRWQHGVNLGQSTGTFAFGGPRAPKHIYPTPGTYTARTIVVDANERADTAFTTVTVGGVDQFPEASVTGHESAVPEGEDVVLTSTSDVGPTALPLSYKWTFDGVGAGTAASSTRRNVVRGTHSWRLIVSNSAGMADTATGSVTVVNAAPTGRFVYPRAAIQEGASFTLSVINSSDAPSDYDGMEWRFSCGSGWGAWGGASGKNCDGVPQGTYLIAAEVRDELGATRSFDGELVVRNKPPVVTIIGHDFNGSRYRVNYQVNDFATDGNWTVTFRVDGVRKGGTQVYVTNGGVENGLWLPAAPGQTITVRVVDKDGAVGFATYEIPDPF